MTKKCNRCRTAAVAVRFRSPDGGKPREFGLCVICVSNLEGWLAGRTKMVYDEHHPPEGEE